MSNFFEKVQEEVDKAKKVYPNDFNNFHEGYAVLLEEVDELWDEIKKKNPDLCNLKKEVIQVSAMCKRIYDELLVKGK